ncbi:MAG: MFS transporter [Clostridia bacterium]|nr:MFS transporter [Clostridia bacterium]
MKLNTKLTVLIGLSFMSILCFWQFYDQVIPFLLEDKFGLSTFKANAIMSVDNILAVFMLPLFGAISDKTNTRIGKRTPYILYGTLASVILLITLGIFQEKNNFLGFMAVLFMLLVVMSIYRSPSVAYMPDVTPKPLRSRANAIINLVGYIGGIFATVVMMFMLKSEKNSDGESVYLTDQTFLPVFIVIAGFMLISVLVMVFSVKENKLSKVLDDEIESKVDSKEKMPKPVVISFILILLSVFLWFMAYNAVTTAFSRYCANVWNTDLGTSSSYLLVATISAIIAFVPLGFLSSALGRKKTVLFGIVLMTVCYTCAIFIRQQTPIMYLIFAFVGIGWAAINVNSFPMIVEMSAGSNVGKYTGYYYAFSMSAQIVTPLLSGLFIDNFGLGYKILFPYAVVFSALSFITMSFVKHGDSKPVKKELLENFDFED